MAATIQTIQKPTKARALDTSGNNNHGQIYSGRALEFDGVSDYLDTNYIWTSNTISICAWLYTEDNAAQKIAVGNRTADNNGVTIAMDGSETIRWEAGASDCLFTTYSYLNQWVRVCAVYDKANTLMSLYVNGVLANTTSADLSLENITGTDPRDFVIGSNRVTLKTNMFVGRISDVQFWDAAFDADDALYDYNNPEQLALNRGGTSLTNSNLKIWYPMNDGHRGQQSYILDASNTGLGDELLTNGDMSSATGWTLGSGWSISGGIATFDGSGGVSLYRSFSASTGDTFKITYDITSYTSGGFRIVYDGTNGTTNSAVGSYTEYVSYKGGNANLFLQSVSTSELSIDNVSVKPVNKKNHATTVFMGEDLWDVADGATAPWSQNSGTSTHTADSAGSVKITPGKGGSGGSYTYLQDDKGLKEDLEVGRTYRLTCDMATDVEGHAITPSVRAGGVNYDGTAITATNLVTNGTMEADSNWVDEATPATNERSTTKVHNGTYSRKFTPNAANEGIKSDTFTTVAGDKILVSAWIYPDDDTQCILRHYKGDGSSINSASGTLTENAWNHVVVQYTDDVGGSSARIGFNSGSTTSGDWYIDDVVVTKFISPSIDWVCADNSDGDYFFPRNMLDTEMITASNDSDFTTPSSNWVHFGTYANAPVYTGGAITFQTTNSYSGAQGIKLGTSSFAALNVGRNYILSLKAGVNTILGSPAIKVRVGDSNIEDQALSTDASTEYTFLLTPTNTTGELKIYHESSSIYTFTIDDIELHPEENVWVDEMVVKEIGLASGWTEADQQLDIPQTALQSYNQLAWFQNDIDGVGATNYVSILDDNALDVGTGDFSVSCWFYLYRVPISSSYLFRKGGAGDKGYAGRVTGTRRISCNINGDLSAGGSNQWTDSDANEIDIGKWYHVVFSYDRSGDVYCYLNGERITSGEFTSAKDITGNNTTCDNTTLFMIGASSSSADGFQGTITEVALFKGAGSLLTEAHAKELYNDGKALDATTHSQKAYLTGYWRNNGLSQWKDLSGEDNHSDTIGNITETMLITAGVDGSRDSQGFLMNRQRTTNSLNLVHLGEGSGTGTSNYAKMYNNPLSNLTDDFSISFWVKPDYLYSTGFHGIVQLGVTASNFCAIGTDTSGHIIAAYEVSGSYPTRFNTGASSISLTEWSHVVVCFSSGTHTGSNNASVLTDSAATWTADELIDGQVHNVTDSGSTSAAGSAKITDNAATTITGTLGGGTEDDWDTSDVYRVMKVYINGVANDVNDDDDTGAPDAVGIDGSYLVGADNSSGRMLNGEVDDVSIYSKWLTAVEVKRNYNAGKRSHR